MATYYAIPEGAMRQFLESQGFKEVTVPRTREIVYGKRHGDLSLRVYTSIVLGSAREVGTDAIRVAIFYRDEQKRIFKVGDGKRVHRVEGWKKNLQNRINHWNEMASPHRCPCCSAPMFRRKVKNKTSKAYGTQFLGCCTWRDTKCDGTIWGSRVADVLTINPTHSNV